MRNRILKSFLCTFLFLFGGVAGGVQAQEINVINARLGVAKAPRFKSECWAQLMVTIRNKGDQADAEVQYTPLSVGFARSTTFFRKRIVVPAHCEVEIIFPVLAQQDEKFVIELYVNGPSGSVAVDKQQFSASMVNIGDPFVLILDDGVTGYSYLKDMKLENRKVTLSIAQSRDMPKYWEVLDSVNVVILGDIDPHKFQQSQIDSMRSWIEAGGILVVSTDERWTHLRGSFVEEWLPVRMYGARPIDAMESLGERYGKPLETKDNLMMCEALPSAGRVLVTLQNLPLLAYQKLGLGAVVFAAVRLDSTTLARWPGLGAMWEEIYTLREKPIEVRRTALETQREQMLSNITGLPVPKPEFVAKLLLGYLGTVAVVFVLFRMRRRLEWGWCSLLVVAPLAAFVYHSVGQSARQEFKSTLNEISVVKMNGVFASEKPSLSTGWIESFHSLYSADEASYNLHATTADSLISQGQIVTESSQAVVPSISVIAEDLIVAEKLRVNEGGLQSFKSFSTRRYEGGVQSSLKWGANGLEGVIRNELGFALQDAMVLFNRQLVSLKTLGKGESKMVQIADPKNASYAPLEVMGGVSLDTTRKQILKNLFIPQSNYNPSQDEPILIGWAEEPASQIADETQHLAKKGLVLFLVALPFERTQGDVLIPRGVCPVRVASALTFQKGRWAQMQGIASGSDIELDFRIPPEVRDLTVEEVKGHFEIENPGSDMEAKLSAWDWTADPTKAWVELGSSRDFTLQEPWRFVLQPIGRVRLKLSVSAIRGKIPTGDTPSMRAFKWRVQDVDIQIKGKLS